MEKLALTLPGDTPVAIPTPNIPGQGSLNSSFTDLGSFISPLLNVVFYIAIFLAFYYLVWGSLSYLMAQGKKDDLGKARARITWALVGLVVIFLAFIVTKYASEIFPQTPGKGVLPF